MIGVIVVCVVLVILINVLMRTGGGSAVEIEKEVWIKCDNCGADYSMDALEYYDFVRKNHDPMILAPPGQLVAMTCEECGEERAFKAFYCKTCKIAFFPGEAEGDYPDECPECGKSKYEERRRSKIK